MKYGVFVREKENGGKKESHYAFKMAFGDDSISDNINYRFNFLIRMGKDVCLVDIPKQEILRKNF